jgi:hypothetical protein
MFPDMDAVKRMSNELVKMIDHALGKLGKTQGTFPN